MNDLGILRFLPLRDSPICWTGRSESHFDNYRQQASEVRKINVLANILQGKLQTGYLLVEPRCAVQGDTATTIKSAQITLCIPWVKDA
jgi:hypothetical protein